jgi:uncharacterized membrane protein
VLLALAALQFLRYSIDHGWLTTPIRMAIGLATGAGLLVLCELKAARSYAVTANALAAAGIVILFSTLFAAHILWHLLGSAATYASMVLVTIVAVALAIRRDSQFIALLGLLGGFATPALLASGEDRPVSLFAYLLLLNAGLAWVGLRRSWPVLPVLSLVFTTVYQWDWVLRFLTASKLPLACTVFLAFPLLGLLASFLVGAAGGRPRGLKQRSLTGDGGLQSIGSPPATPRSPSLPSGGEGDAPAPDARTSFVLAAGGRPRDLKQRDDDAFARTAAVSAALPLLFFVYAAAVPAYGARFALLFGFLFVLAAGLTVVAAVRGPRALYPLAAAVSVVVLAVWLGLSYSSAAWPSILGFVALLVLFYLSAPGLFARLGLPLGEEGRLGALAAPLLLAAFPALLRIEPAAAAPGLPFGVLFALLAAVAFFALLYEQGLLHFIAAFFAIGAEAVWSARHLTAERLLAGVALYAAFGLFYLGVPLLARRLGRRLEPRESGSVLLLASIAMLFFLATGRLAPRALWGLGLLLFILNAGLLVEARASGLRLPRLAGTVLSWMVIAAWWAAIPLAAQLVPALFLVAGFAVLGLAGSVAAGPIGLAGSRPGLGAIGGTPGRSAAAPAIGGTPGGSWTERPAAASEGAAAGSGLFLALAGHGFLLFVAAQESLALPPWPLLGVLAVLDLAIGVAALWLRTAALWIAALAASDVILVTWVTQAQAAPWPSVALACALAVAALGLGWFALARRAEAPPATFSRSMAKGAAASLFFGQAVLMAAALAPGSPPLAAVIGGHVVLLAAILALSGPAGWPRLAPWSVAATAAAVAVSRAAQSARQANPWWAELAFAAAVYVLYLVFPVLLGKRARRLGEPYVAAVLASIPFFFFARDALDAGGLGGWIGALPVTQAIALALLLAQLRRIEAAAAPERDRGRLALVAGAVLAFVTAAIPLQLDREWITIGWALLAAALAWLYTRVPHRGLLSWTAGLLAASFLRLAVNPAVLSYHPRGELPVWNWYLYTYLIPAAAFFAAAWFLARGDDRLVGGQVRLSALSSGAAAVLLFLLVNIEIADSFSTGDSLTFAFLSGRSGIAENLTYTLAWGVFATLLLVAGIILRKRAARLAAILLLLAAALKGFVLDMARLHGLYRAGSFAGLAVCLALVAVLIQKFVLAARRETEA